MTFREWGESVCGSLPFARFCPRGQVDFAETLGYSSEVLSYQQVDCRLGRFSHVQFDAGFLTASDRVFSPLFRLWSR